MSDCIVYVLLFIFVCFHADFIRLSTTRGGKKLATALFCVYCLMCASPALEKTCGLYNVLTESEFQKEKYLVCTNHRSFIMQKRQMSTYLKNGVFIFIFILILNHANDATCYSPSASNSQMSQKNGNSLSHKSKSQSNNQCDSLCLLL